MEYDVKGIRDVIQKVTDATGNEKIAILEQHKDVEGLKDYLFYVYSKTLAFKIKKVPEPEEGNFFVDKYEWNIFTLLDMLNTGALSGKKAIREVALFLGNSSQEEADLLRFVILRDIRAGINRKGIEKVFPGLLDTGVHLSKCEAYNQKAVRMLTFPCVAELKVDASRAICITKNGEVDFFLSSGGLTIYKHSDTKFALIEEIEQRIKGRTVNESDCFVLDGELLATDSSGRPLERAASNGILSKVLDGTATQAEKDSFVFVIWDAIDWNTYNGNQPATVPYTERREKVEEICGSCIFTRTKDVVPGRLMAVYATPCLGVDHAKEIFLSLATNGEEGIILKSKTSVWEPKRKKDWVKFKLEIVSTLKAIGYNEGKGKFEGQVGSIILQSEDGLVEVAISGFTDSIRKEISDNREYYLDKCFDVKHNGLIKDKDQMKWSLFLPRFMDFRLDKAEADTFEQIESKL